ncbi:MAG: hypothetical protein AUJ02_09475 [Chloroflexi bacterium 13_1_40CM_3_65_12]|nr:MAG: hypothetical protein AUJ02_09475 [Chloroflexi bacterium 13_1_40CM_3_65_12]
MCRKLGHQGPSVTATRPLPGNESELEPAEVLGRRCGIPALAAMRLQGRHGSNAEAVMKAAHPGRMVCRCEPITEAELVHAARHEQVHSLADAFRRVGLAAGPCAGTACVLRAAGVIGTELGWSASQRFEAAREFVRGAWLGRAPILGHSGWAQEELAMGSLRGLRN